jgi:hypothetical protein
LLLLFGVNSSTFAATVLISVKLFLSFLQCLPQSGGFSASFLHLSALAAHHLVAGMLVRTGERSNHWLQIKIFKARDISIIIANVLQQLLHCEDITFARELRLDI